MVNRSLKRENSNYIKNSVDNVLSCFELNERYSAALEFAYDAMGNRISKLVKTRTGTGLDTEDQWIKTYYVRDAQGNVMATYERTWMNMVIGGYDSSDNLTLKEQDIYGSSRLGLRRPNLTLAKRPFNIVGYQQGGPYMVYSYAQNVTVTGVNPLVSQYEVGRTQYELSNHLGNVLTVISDNVWADGGVDHPVKSFSPDVLAVNDYYPGGSIMPGRSFNSSATRYGFNGMEKDDEVKGVGNHYTAPFWEYDPRLARRWNVDPVVKHHESPFATFANNPIWFVDPSGADSTLYFNSSGDQIGQSHDGLENAVVSIGDDQLENFNRLRSAAGDLNDDQLNAELRSLGTAYDVDGFKEFFNCNLCDINRDWSDGSGFLYANEHQTFLYEINGMVRIGEENIQGGVLDMEKRPLDGANYPSLFVGSLHTHPNAGLYKYIGQVFANKPTNPSDYRFKTKPFFDIVVSEKYIYFINNIPNSNGFAVNFNKTFETTPIGNPFQQ